MTSICIIGAGVAGLTTLKWLTASSGDVDVVVFDRNDSGGGLWSFGDKEPEYGTPSVLYKHLRAITPKEGMTLQGHPWADGSPCYPDSAQLKKYLTDYADKFDLNKHIQYNHEVLKVTRLVSKWSVQLLNKTSSTESNQKFDKVIVCSGLHDVQSLPDIPGMTSFPGHVIHSSQYRFPDVYAGKTVLMIGGWVSMIDICQMVSKYAQKIFISSRGKLKWGSPDNCKRDCAVVKEIRGSTVKFEDGTSEKVDCIILCTGFKRSTEFPFLDASCEVSVKLDHFYPIYNGIVHALHPSLMFNGFWANAVYFPLSELMAIYMTKLITGTCKLPTQVEMLADIESEYDVYRDRKHFYSLAASGHQIIFAQKIRDLGGIDYPMELFEICTLMNKLANEGKIHLIKDHYKLIVNSEGKYELKYYDQL